MPATVTLEGDVIHATVTGALSPELLRELQVQLEAIEEGRPTIPHRVIDLSLATSVDLSFDGVAALARARASRTFPSRYKLALVAPDRVRFGYARMYQTLADNPSTVLAIFATVADARAWIAEPGFTQPAAPWRPA